MAEANNIIEKGSQDLKTIEDFVNLPAGSVVNPRLLPSVDVGTLSGIRDAIFEAGGLPATPFKTKALMTASALADGKYAQVTDDTINNGLYLKEGGVWVKSAYDPVSLAAADATTKDNAVIDGTKAYIESVAIQTINEIVVNDKTALNAQSKKELDAYFGDYQNGLLIDPTQDSEYQVLTVTNGVRIYESIDSKIGALFVNPKIVKGKNGTYSWSRHNASVKTNALDSSTSKSRATVSAGAKSVRGDNSAYLVTTTEASENSVKQGLIGSLNRRYLTTSIVIKALEGATHAYLANAFGAYALFDLVNGAVGSVSGTYNESIVKLGYGYYRITASYFNDVYGSIAIGLSDNNSKVPIKSGLKASIEQLQTNMGGVAQNYLENTTESLKCLPTFDYRSGNKSLLVEANRNFEGMYSDDLTRVEWVKTGLNVALSATNIANDPCSRLTASAASATALQATAKTLKLMSVFIKRVTGVGSVSLTLDGGTTWQDVTSQIASDGYNRIIVVGSGTSYGIKLSSANDVVDVCMFNPTADYNESSPVPYVFGNDAAILPDAANMSLPASRDNLLYYKAYVGELKNKFNRYSPVTLYSNNASVRVLGAADSEDLTQYQGEATTKMATSQGSPVLEVVMLTSDTQSIYEGSINGGYSVQVKNSIPTNIANIKLAPVNSGNKSFEKLLLINEDVKLYDISTFKYNKPLKKQGDSITATITKEKQFVNTTMMREPTLFILNDDGETVEMLVTHMNKLTNGHHSEAPARLLQRRVMYSKSRNDFSYITPTQVMYEHPTWAQGKGHNQSPAVVRIKQGVNAGRLLCVFTRLDGDDFTAPRNTYLMTNDDNGNADAWSVPVKIIDSTAVFDNNTAVVNPDGSILVLPQNHKISPNRIITNVYNEGWFASIYSDDNGTTWQAGSKVYTFNANEPTITHTVDGYLLVNQRTDNAGERITHKSIDGGLTWTLVGTIDDTSIGQVSGSLINLGSTTNPNKIDDLRMVIAGSGRKDLTVNKLSSDLLSIDSSFTTMDSVRYVGYSSAKPILNNEYLAISFEGGTFENGFNGDNSSYLSVVKL